MKGFRISCANKRKLYLIHRNSNDHHLKEHYKKYCKILNMVILAAKKKIHYNNLLLKSNNKTKTTWNIVKIITNHKHISNTIKTMKINGKNSNNPLVTANCFNSYFSSVAENLIAINSSETNTINKMNPITWLRQNFSQLLPH